MKKQRLVIRTGLVPDQVSGGRALAAARGDILDTTGVVPVATLRSLQFGRAWLFTILFD